MGWDAAKGVSTSTPADPLNAWQDVGTPFRARRAADGAVAAAWALCGYNVYDALWHWGGAFHGTTLLGSDPAVLLFANVVVATAAACFAVFLRRRRPLWALVLLVGWCVMELAMPFTRWLYGHAIYPHFAGLSVAVAVLALRGQLSLRKLEQEGALQA